jgi:single-strand DNA-binding protein
LRGKIKYPTLKLMEKTMNKVELIGNLGCDVELKYTKSGKSVANFRLATTERWEKNGQEQSRTEWHRIVAWGKTAEQCAENFSKGSFVRLTGALKTRSWDDKNDVKHFTTEVHVYRVELMKKRNDKEG